jgi:predicted ABC-type ATPase
MTIYVIAGPPGVGKSTSASNFIPLGTPIVDQDLAGYQYKKQGFNDYKDLASLRSNQQIREFLFAQQNFALELNLGFESHYDYLKSIAYFNPVNQVHLVLFYTDHVALCLDRANLRYLNGGHLVKPQVVEEMYSNTFRLFERNKQLFQVVRLIDVKEATPIECCRGMQPLPDWIIHNNLSDFLP